MDTESTAHRDAPSCLPGQHPQSDAHADPHHQAPAAGSATGPTIGGSPESLVFVNPLFAASRETRDTRS